MTITTGYGKVSLNDGSHMSYYFAKPEAALPETRHILLFQEIFGINSHIRDVASRLSDEGHVVVAPDMFHRSAERFEGDYDKAQVGMAYAKRLTAEGIAVDIIAARQALVNDVGFGNEPKLAAIGFCLGGRLAYIANALLPLQAAVSFYGGGIDNALDLVSKLHGPRLLFWGGKDNHIRPENRGKVVEALRAANHRYVNVEFGLAGHGFFCDQRQDYDPPSAEQAWALTKAFLRGEAS